MTDMTLHPMWPEQERIELEMATRGIERFKREAEEAYRTGTASKVGGPRFVLKHLIEPTAVAITAFTEAAKGAKAGRRHTLVRFVDKLPAETLAYLTAKLLLDGANNDVRLAALGVRVGLAVEIEQRIAACAVERPYLDATIDDLNRRTANEQHRRKVVMAVLRSKGDNWTAWTKPEALAVGIKLLELLIEATGIATITSRRTAGKTTYVVSLTEAALEWMGNVNDRLAMLRPEHLPCVVPPKAWTSPSEGAYYTDALLSPPTLVKTRNKDHRKALASADLSLVYRAVNAIQSTPWAIETRTLAVMQTIIDKRLDLDVLPSMDPMPIPERPGDVPMKVAPGDAQPILTDDQQSRLNAWKAAARDAYTSNEQAISRRVQVLKAAALATEFSKYPAIYFPHQLDFRGRCYAIPQVLNPQGPDYAKGLLVFAEGTPLDNERAQGWFMIHGANTFGNDKVPFDERIAWVEEHHDAIIACAEDPLANLWWTEADAPFCFLTWAFEYRDWNKVPLLEFTSRIPVGLDGTCNGLQHYSAMLRDPVGGAAVNLVPAEKPQDIYAEVARVVTQRLAALVEVDDTGDYVVAAFSRQDEVSRAHNWLAFGIDRSITKRPVMVLPYGGTIRSCHDYVMQAVKEKIAAGAPNPFGDDLRPACTFLASVVWDSIGDVVVAARAAMGWLMDVTRLATNDGQLLDWTTPSGFPVHQAYPVMSTVRIKTQIHGSTAKVNLTEEKEDSLDKRRQANGIAPNFVHSLDAAALVLTVNLALDNGVKHFAMIHDSYGSTAGSTDMLAACTRHAFVDMYKENAVLEQFRSGVLASMSADKVRSKVPSLPTAGGLDLDGVISSAFFFA